MVNYTDLFLSSIRRGRDVEASRVSPTSTPTVPTSPSTPSAPAPNNTGGGSTFYSGVSVTPPSFNSYGISGSYQQTSRRAPYGNVFKLSLNTHGTPKTIFGFIHPISGWTKITSMGVDEL